MTHTDAGALLKLADRLRNFAVWNARQSHYEPVPLCREAAEAIEAVARQAASQGSAGDESTLRPALQEIDEIGRKITDLKNEYGIRMGNIAHAALLGAGGAARAPTEPVERTYLRGWNEGIECAAELIEQQQERITETSEGSERSLSPRMTGNQMGLAYAAGIRDQVVPSAKVVAQACTSPQRTALQKCSGALGTMPGNLKIAFTGEWAHLGTATISEILDEADAALSVPSAHRGGEA